MEKKEIERRNEAIAKFMGKKRRYESTEQIFIELLKYHDSWDWLMPVVETIEGIEEIDRNRQK